MVSNTTAQLAHKVLTTAFGTMFGLSYLKNGARFENKKALADFAPVLRFAVCSDIHLNGEEDQAAAIRFARLFEDMYAYSAQQTAHPTFDAVVVAGDFSGGGDEKQYQMYNRIIAENKREETQVLTILGNHEFIDYRDVDATVGYTVYKKYISEEVDTHTVLNGYHFIGVSYNDDGKKFSTKLGWLDAELKKTVAATPDKPVFVYQHPHPTATVYGSINWGTFEVRKVLQKYPQVFDFSGHSHYAPSDPRSVWQGSFTAVGCGSLSAFMGNLNYIDGDKDAPGKSGGFWLVEADAKGNVRMRLYDIENRVFFNNIEYYFTDLNKSNKRTYTWAKQKAPDTAPQFPQNATVIAEKDENGNCILSFSSAKGFYEAENYKIKICDNNKKTVWQNTVISDYVRATGDETNANIGKLKAGSYTAIVTAYSPYAKKGDTLKHTFTVSE
ncbi:MAG: metallophosphoesterase [Clostridia bacterium]|nr:metallophosphoesterase [Clostridia bacterium]